MLLLVQYGVVDDSLRPPSLLFATVSNRRYTFVRAAAGLQSSSQERRVRGDRSARDCADCLYYCCVGGRGDAKLAAEIHDVSIDKVDLGYAPALEVLQHRGLHVTVTIE